MGPPACTSKGQKAKTKAKGNKRKAKSGRQKAKGKKRKAKGRRQNAEQTAADLVPVLHKVDAFVHIPEQNECFDHIQAGNQDGSVKEGGAHQIGACPLVGFQAIANGENDVPLEACQVGDWPPELPAAIRHSCERRGGGGGRKGFIAFGGGGGGQGGGRVTRGMGV